MANREIIELLKRYVLVLRSEGINVDMAFLYGSYLSNTATDESDIDVMIVTDIDDDYLIGMIWSLTKKVNSRIEPYLVEKRRFINSENSPLIELVKTTGLKIA